MLRAGLGKIDENLRALDRTRIDHADILLVPIVKMDRDCVLLFFQIRPWMMHKKRGLQLPIHKSIVLDGVGDTPDAVELLEKFHLAQRTDVARHTTSKWSKGELFSSMYNADAAYTSVGHFEGGSGLHGKAIVGDDMRG